MTAGQVTVAITAEEPLKGTFQETEAEDSRTAIRENISDLTMKDTVQTDRLRLHLSAGRG